MPAQSSCSATSSARARRRRVFPASNSASMAKTGSIVSSTPARLRRCCRFPASPPCFYILPAQPVTRALMQAIHQALPQAAVTNAYGTTEAGPVVFGPHPAGLPQPEMSVGYPHPQVEVRLVADGNRDAAEGVLEMRCPAVMNGYH